MINLSICDLFDNTSKHVWKEVSMTVENYVNPSELGITNNVIIPYLRQFIKNHKFSGIWVSPAKQEHIHGGDIDLYIQLDNGKYIRLLLQAKIIKQSGNYDKINYQPNNQNTTQLELLKNVDSKRFAKPLYILYSGGNEIYSNVDCKGKYTQEDLGICLVDVFVIEQLLMAKSKISFNDIKTHAIPFRSIICCDTIVKKLERSYTQYGVDEINLDKKFDPYYTKTPDSIGFISKSEKDIKVFNNNLVENGLNTSCRIIVNRKELINKTKITYIA